MLKTLEEFGSLVLDAAQRMADQAISFDLANQYWCSVPATLDGVLGGFGDGPVPAADIDGSKAFIERLRKLSPKTFPNGPFEGNDKSCLDVGAGIGRVTKELLSNYGEKIDLLEQAAPLINQAKVELSELTSVRTYYECGMQSFNPEHSYWLIWCQWCLGHLPDVDLVAFLERCKNSLQPGGLIIIKENNSMTNTMYDELDSSVTRTDADWRTAFQNAGLRPLLISVQKGMPEELFPIRMYALAPQP